MRIVLFVFVLLFPTMLWAEDRLVRLYAAPALIDSGLIQHIKPRFSLKTQVGVDLVDRADDADLTLEVETGRALFSGLGETWHMDMRTSNKATERFANWLTSAVGARTIQSFAPDGTPLFTEPKVQKTVSAPLEMDGDAIAGRSVSLTKCGRCHVTERGQGVFGIGSTPSFFVMRSFEDWELRFSGFYILRPHAAFTQIAEVTDPFPIDRPSPIAPIELTLDDLEAILAYVAALEPADLGDPLKHQ